VHREERYAFATLRRLSGRNSKRGHKQEGSEAIVQINEDAFIGKKSILENFS
jgi:hypothetical protein